MVVGGILLVVATVSATDLVWVGGTGNWNAAGNWTPAQVPGTADNAFITNNGTYTVTVPASTAATAGGLVIGGGAGGTQTLSIDRATLTLNGASVVNTNGNLDLTVSQSVLNGSGDLMVNGTLNWANGTMSGTGTTSIGSSGFLVIGSGGVTLTRTVNNDGTTTWAGGNLTASTGATINNLAGGTFDITADGHLNGIATTPISNSGIFRQTAGTASTILTAPFNNSGTVEVLTAALSLNLGGTHTGTISNAPGATLQFSGGSHALAVGSLVTGTGIVSVNGNATTLTASGTFDAGSSLSVTAGTVTLAPSCDVNSAILNINGANSLVNFNSSGTVAGVNLTGGTLGGTSPVAVTGLLTLSGGSITSALVTADGGLNINGSVTLNGGKLINPGLAIWSAGNFIGANGAVFSNLLGATFINTFDGNASSGAGATPTFVNAGTFAKTNGTAVLGTTSIDFQFINTGTVEVQTNTLRYTINQQTGGLTILDGGNLDAQAQPIQFVGGSLVGTGLVTVANLQNVINSATISPGFPLGELDISGNYQQTASGTLNIELGGNLPGTNLDLVTVSGGGAGGVATLGGTLNVTLTNGFSPAKGATFTFLTALSRVGAFAAFNYPSNDIGMQVSYDATSAKVTVSNLKPLVANPIVDPPPVIYGSAFNFQFPADTFTDPDNDPLSYVATGLPPGITFVGATRTFSGIPTQTGVFPVEVAASDGGSPSLTVTNSFTITIDPSPLSIAADPQVKTYGAADPELTYAVTGLQFSDTRSSVLTGALTRSAGESVAGSPYAIAQGTLVANGNYAINFTGSTLSISPATLTVAAQPGTKTYGTADPALTFAVNGLQFNETAATALSGALTRAAGETVTGGPYAITQGTLVANANYTISFAGNTLAITKAALSVTASDKTKTYGGADPAFTVNFTAFVNGENQSVLGGTLAFARAAGENVGDYLITPSGLTSGNYIITFNTGNLNIARASLSVTADNQTKTYGDTDPVLTFAVSGLQFNDTVATALTGALTRTPGESVADGPYSVTQGTLVPNGNYVINFTGSTLTIIKAALSVIADAQTKSYGAIDPALTFAVVGLKFSDTVASALTGVLARSTGESVAGSPYGITAGTLTPNGNYTIGFTASALTITKAVLSVVADARSKTYGASDPGFTVTYGGFVNGEDQAVLSGALAFTRAPGENAGSYSITPSGLNSGNYAITFENGTFTIAKAALSVTADTKTKTYGMADPAFTVTYDGFVNGEDPGVLSGTLAFTRTPGENAGSYSISPSGLTSDNYAIDFNTGTLTITAPAPLLFPPTVTTTNIVIIWTAVTNGTYQVQFNPGLSTAGWTDLSRDVVSTGNTATNVDDSVPTNVSRFYRVRVLP